MSSLIKPLFLAGLILFVAVALRGSFSWTSLESLPATSDEASSVLLAKQISEGSRPLLFIGQPYQFPIESYLMAPFVDLMPRNAVGARYQALLLGAVTTCVMLLTVWLMFPAGARWPPVLLTLLPSAYWLQHQSGYTPPQYAMFALLASLVFLFVVLAHKNKKILLMHFLAGLTAGLLLSNHLLGLSVVIGASIVLIMQALKLKKVRLVISYLTGAAIGIVPFVLALLFIEGAYEGVSYRVPSQIAWQQLHSFAIGQTIPGVFGINPVLFTDIYEHIGWGASLRLPFLIIFAAVVLLAGGSRIKKGIAKTMQQYIPDSHPVDMFLIVIILAVTMFVYSSRSYSQGYRFLLVLVWCFPFLVGYLYLTGGQIIKNSLAVFVVVYASFNAVASADMIGKWKQDPGGVKTYAHTPDLAPLLEYLNEKEIEHCYAGFWVAYRVTFESDEAIICAMPYNERFQHWPVPFKRLVDKQSDVPFILLQTNRSELTPEMFEFDLAKSHFYFEQTEIGPFWMYHDFTHPEFALDRKLPISSYRVSLLSDSRTDIKGIHDSNIETNWMSEGNQQKWMGLEVTLDEPSTIQRISLVYNENEIQVPKMIWLYTLSNGEWEFVKKVWFKLTKMDYVDGNPKYGKYQKVIWLDRPKPIEAIRLMNAIPDYTAHWSIAELELGERVESSWKANR